MRRAAALAVAAAALGCATVTDAVSTGEPRVESPVASSAAPPGSGTVQAPTPLLDARLRTAEYLGPGRDDATPEGLREIRIAWFGPPGTDHADWGSARRGADLAVEVANRSGGCRGLPVRLLGAWSDSPWGSGTADLAKLVYDEDVWAIVGGVNGATTHLAEQVAAKARIAVVSPGGTDPGVHFTNVAWMFTLPATDDRIAPVLVDAVRAHRGDGPWAVVGTADRDAHSAWRAVRRVLTRRGEPAPALHLTLPPAAADWDRAARDVQGSGSRSVLVLANARDSARIVRSLRAAGFDGFVVGGAPVGQRPFVDESSDAAEGVAFPLLFDAGAPDAAAFVGAYEARWGEQPDFLAAHAHDAVAVLVDAVRRAGPNRALIRDALAALPPWCGATGPVTWDATGRNAARVVLGEWRGGRTTRPGR